MTHGAGDHAEAPGQPGQGGAGAGGPGRSTWWWASCPPQSSSVFLCLVMEYYRGSFQTVIEKKRVTRAVIDPEVRQTLERQAWGHWSLLMSRLHRAHAPGVDLISLLSAGGVCILFCPDSSVQLGTFHTGRAPLAP